MTRVGRGEHNRFPDAGGRFGAVAPDPIWGWYEPDAPTIELPVVDGETSAASAVLATPPPTAPAPRGEVVHSPRRASLLVAAGIGASRTAGLVREMVIGFFMGVGPAADAFKAAQRIPNLMQHLLGEGVLSASFIPVYAKLRSDGDDEAAGRLAGSIAAMLLALTGVLSLAGVVLAEPIAHVLVTGFSGGPRFDLTVDLLRITFPGIGCLVLSAWCLGVLNSHRKFFLPYVAPVLWNAAQIAVVMVAGLAGFDDRSIAMALAWGVLVGGFLQMAVQLPSVLLLLGRLRLSLRSHSAPVRTVLGRFGPVVMARGVVQIMGYLHLWLAAFLATGAISSLTLAQTLYLLPISLFGMSVAAAELPDLSTLDADDATSRRDFRRRLENGKARILFYVAPTATAYLVAGDVIVALLFGRGEITPTDEHLIWLTIAALSLGLPATTASRLLQNALYGLGDTRTPARLAVVRVFAAAGVGLTLMFPLDRLTIRNGEITGWDDMLALGPLGDAARDNPAGLAHLGIVGLALGAAVSAWLEYHLISTALAWRVGRSRLGGRWLNPIALACAAMALVALLATRVTGHLDATVTAPFVLLPAGLTYLIVTRWLGVPESQIVTERLRALVHTARRG
jgi:putative peptidoglycan lipid II flippase